MKSKKNPMKTLKTSLIIMAVMTLFTGCASPKPTQEIVITESQRAPGTILFVLSTASEQVLANGASRETGFFLNEFYEAYKVLVEHGYEVAIATPGGLPPVVDPESLEPKYWADNPDMLAEANQFVARSPSMREPLSLEEARRDVEEFQGIVVPGGQGVMFDLLDDKDLHWLLIRFGETSRPVGLICHTPVILTRIPAEENPFSGRIVTSVSGTEEWFIETFIMRGKAQDRRLGRQLHQAGFRYSAARPGGGYALRDCNLVTSQNPFSGEEFNVEFLEALTQWRAGGVCSP